MRQAWHTIPSCVYRSLRSLHICHPSQCMRGHSKTPLHFVLVGRKLRVFRSGPSISKLSRFPNKALWLPWVPQKGTYAVRFRSIFLLDRYFPIATPSPHQLDRYIMFGPRDSGQLWGVPALNSRDSIYCFYMGGKLSGRSGGCMKLLDSETFP